MQITQLGTIIISSALLLSCSSSKESSSSLDENKPEYDLSLWPKLNSPIKPDPILEDEITILLNKMTLEQKVGQMVQAEITWVEPEDVKKYHLGSVLNGGGSFLNGDRNASVSDWVNYMDAIYLASMDTSEGGLAIPVTYGIDAVHGNNKFIGATLYPHNIGLGAMRNPKLIRKIGDATAKEVLLVGIDWTFAPTLAVVRDDRWGRTYEGYSEDPDIVASYAGEMVEGIQGVVGQNSFLDEHHIYATAKHWVGDGGTHEGIDRGNNFESEQDLIRIHAAAYLPAIEAGVQSIMASHHMWHGTRLHGSKYLLTDVLKNRLGFDGFVVGDWNSHALIPGCENDDCPEAVNAGIDMFMVVEDWKDFIENTVEQVQEGIIPQARIDDAVRRILRVKIRSGLFEKGLPSKRLYANKKELLGAKAHRDIARQAVRESLVLLKNNDNLLPLARNQTILLAGDGADNMSKQTGGWTINWTGEGNEKSDFPNGSSIYDGFKSYVEKAGGKVILDKNGEFEQRPDVAVVVFGENPYAEWIGDVKTIAYQEHSHRDAKLIESLKKQRIPVVAVFLSGRPLWMNRVINAADAFVAAWLPGSEGIGIADVLLKTAQGQVNHDFKGKLSFSWPQYASQVVLNRGDKNYDPLFAYDFGLTYKDSVNLAQLNVDSDFTQTVASDAPYMIMQGRPSTDWVYQLKSGDVSKIINTPIGEIDGFSMIEADKLTQGDAKEFVWQKDKPVSVLVTSAWNRKDLSDYLASNSAMVFEIRKELPVSGPLTVSVGCGMDKCGEIDISPLISKFEQGQWQELSIDLLCFAKAGADFERSSAPFIMSSAHKTKVRVANVRYVPKLGADAQIKCRD